MTVKRILKLILPILVGATLAALSAYILCHDYPATKSYAVLAYVGGMVISFPLCTVFHELGHMFFGFLVKFKATPHFALFKASSCDIMPKCSKGVRGRMIAVSMGGLVFNLLLVALGVIALAIPQVPTYLTIFMPYSAYMFVLNSIPTYYLDGKSDALIIEEFIRGDDAAKVTVAVLTVQAKIYEGEKIEECGELLFDLPQIQEDDEAFIALTDLRAKYYEAVGDSENTQKQRERLEQLKEYVD